VLHYISFRYITLHFILLHYVTLHLMSFRCVRLHYIKFRYATLHYISLQFNLYGYVTLDYISFHFVTLRYITLRFILFHYITFHFVAFRYTTSHFILLHCVTLHFISLRYVTLHYITFHFNSLPYVTLHVISLRYIYISFHFVTGRYISFPSIARIVAEESCLEAGLVMFGKFSARPVNWVHVSVWSSRLVKSLRRIVGDIVFPNKILICNEQIIFRTSIWNFQSLLNLIRLYCGEFLHGRFFSGPFGDAKCWAPHCFGPIRRRRPFVSAQTWVLPQGQGNEERGTPPGPHSYRVLWCFCDNLFLFLLIAIAFVLDFTVFFNHVTLCLLRCYLLYISFGSGKSI